MRSKYAKKISKFESFIFYKVNINICRFLDIEDIFNLRLTSKTVKHNIDGCFLDKVRFFVSIENFCLIPEAKHFIFKSDGIDDDDGIDVDDGIDIDGIDIDDDHTKINNNDIFKQRYRNISSIVKEIRFYKKIKICDITDINRCESIKYMDLQEVFGPYDDISYPKDVTSMTIRSIKNYNPLTLNNLPTLNDLHISSRSIPPLKNLPISIKTLYIKIIGHPNISKDQIDYMNMGDLLPNLLDLTFIAHTDIDLDNLPASLKNLDIFSYSKTIDHLPASLVSLIISKDFNQRIDNLPTSLQILRFLFVFDQPIDHLPSTLTHLQLGSAFNNRVDNLPSSLKHLDLGTVFNQNVDYLPVSLTHLILGTLFNKNIDHLPASLTHLTFGYDFNRGVDYLPLTLTHLKFNHQFNQPVDNLPLTLTHLIFGYCFNQYVDHLPSTLKYLTFGNSFNKGVDNLPSSLISLKFGGNFYQPVNHLPKSLKRLRFSFTFNKTVDYLPSTLSHLKIGYLFCESIDHLTSLRSISMFSRYNSEILKRLPDGVEHIKIYDHTDYNLGNIDDSMSIMNIPTSVRSVYYICDNPNGDARIYNVPSHLKRLHIRAFSISNELREDCKSKGVSLTTWMLYEDDE
jgi:hypothetical protein